MKKTRKIYSVSFIALLLLVTLVIIQSCKDNNENIQTDLIVIQKFNLRKFSNDYSKGTYNNQFIDLISSTYSSQDLILKNISEKTIVNSNNSIYAVIEYFNEDSSLIAYEVFYSNTGFRHLFYITSNTGSTFDKVFDLKDNMVNFNNIEFLVHYFLDNLDGLFVKMHLNDSFEKSVVTQISEFEVFKTVKLFNLEEDSLQNDSLPVEFATKMKMASGSCNPICSGGFGSCNTFSMSCGGADPGGCRMASIAVDDAFQNNFPSVDLLSKFDNYYALRDNFLNTTVIGKKLISYYYSLSSSIDIKDFSISDYAKIVSMLPEINEAVDKINNNRRDIVINDNLKNNFLEFIEILKTKSTSNSYQLILNDLKSEIINLSGKNEIELVDEMILYE
ncbi:hypothetical protein C7447_101715 [Tenacibaculum adriaticum]|uniref:Lipoprotein n=1 Tax=Tenacibaculum adriaticum TaxID=413713 RepID=A0A5S5DWA8_9FLAO|nr:hypothetical protein [Tenacibaculum adriaticum]TYQ00106.1 hypothetical protein C7447_101715 [Tenacibaculum adriaticum]